ncbi:hypothetical protein BGZ99_010298 [Dissophora globulifera]|uniref:F-box domain-containing protein n=1 Tax=Dissophora globulifera TaxID=979702 RepID=A0A9P6UYF7_9FUNG|nr:hypothetical protein BGZ99_010298 [Dissophora globulifera]
MPDFIAPGLNPLEIPEIIAMVGKFIPLSRRVISTDFFNFTITSTSVFSPYDLLVCTTVSRTWRRILLPILWRSYDGALMRYVPLAVLQANSVYFRSFRDQLGHHHSGPFLATNLRQLIISQQHDWAVPFMITNPGLQHLTWTGSGHALLDKEYEALINLTNLGDLCLSNWSLSGQQLALILCASPRLSRLSLSFVDGVQDLKDMLTLYTLEEISLGYMPRNSQCLMKLVQYCPSLRRISFLGTWEREQERDLLKLCTWMRRCCPELCSIHFAASYCFGTNDFNMLEDFEYAALVQSAQSLNFFAAEVPCLGPMLTSSLIGQFEALVAVDVCIRRKLQHQYPHDGGGSTNIMGDADKGDNCNKSAQFMDVANSARILSSCSHLRVFRLSSAENMIDMGAALELFTNPWACLDLEILSLGQISLPASNKNQDRRAAMQCSFGDYGWHVHSKANTSFASASKAAATSMALSTLGMMTPVSSPPCETDDDLWAFGSEFRQKLLPQVGLLTVLKELCLNKVQYRRATII